MRTRDIARLALVVVSSVVLAGCTIRHGDFTVISGKLVDVGNFKLGSAERRKAVVGEDMADIIIVVPTSVPTLDGALDDACAKGGGDVMTDAVVTYRWWWIPYIYGQEGWRVTGDVVKTRGN